MTIELNQNRIERILRKLKEVRGKGLKCFGSDSHRFRLNTRLNEQTIVRFEKEQGITLPSDFRSFLKLAGNGGAGPYYGITKLEQCYDLADWMSDDRPSNLLAMPSPLHPAMNRDNDWMSQFTDCISPYQGTIAIGTQGCTYEVGLIVTGSFAGRVVYLDADGQAPYVTREPDFLSWYERWLDELLGGYETLWFGYGIGGDEPKLMQLLRASDSTKEDRTEALNALRRLPQLSMDGRLEICKWIVDFNAEIRAAVCAVVEQFKIVQSKPAIRELLTDESPEVLKAAISANLSLCPDDVEDILQLLRSENVEVANHAFFELNKREKIPRELSLELIETSPHGNLRYLVAHAIEWTQSDLHRLIRLLKDEHQQVRSCAILGLRKIKSTESLSAVVELLKSETDQNAIDHILRLLGEVPGDQNAAVLLEWTYSLDDFHRLTAVDSLCKLGDIRVKPIVMEMLCEKRSPVRVSETGRGRISNSNSISELVSKSLRASPNSKLRRLVSKPSWLSWFG